MKSYSTNMFVSLLTSEQQQANNLDGFPHSSRDVDDLHHQVTSTETTAVPLDEALDTNENQILAKVDTRETWSNNCDYLITTLGGLIGLGTFFSTLKYLNHNGDDAEKHLTYHLLILKTRFFAM